MIAASVLIGIVVAVAVGSSSTTEYKATHDLIYAPSQNATGTDETVEEPAATVDRYAFLATRGEVLARAAERLGESDPAALQLRVSASGNGDRQTISITATGTDAAETRRVANTFATELVATLDEEATVEREREIANAQAQVNQLRDEVALLPLGTDERDALSTQYTDALEQLRLLASDATPTSGVSTVESASAVVTSTGTGDLTRLLLAGFVGLIIGAGLALVLTRFDTRLHSKEEAEQAFGLPVIAEIPNLSRAGQKRHDIVSLTDPESLGAEAYRSLRTLLVVAPRVRRSLSDESPRRGRRGSGADEAEPPVSQVVLVVSPGPSEGKSTSVANLAVAFAETGKYVLVISGDLRRPMVDKYLGVKEGPGFSELLAGEEDLRFVDVVRATSVPNVRMVPSGRSVSNPGELLSHHGLELIDEARSVADIVLIDSPPVLATDDISPLLPRIDEVLIVCRAGGTTAEAARRTSELLNRLGASVAGVALVGVLSIPTIRGYYRAYGSTQARPAPGGRRGDGFHGDGVGPVDAPRDPVKGRRRARTSDVG